MVDAASNSSMTTIFALVNLMVGGAMLTFPVLFRDSGLAMGSFLLLLSGYISYKTCWVYLFHLSPGDVDIEAAIKRVLGPKW